MNFSTTFQFIEMHLYVLAIDLLVGGVLFLFLACIVHSMSPALWGVIPYKLYVQQQYFLHARSSKSRYLLCCCSRSILPRPNTSTLSLHYHANPSESYDRTVFISHQCEMSFTDRRHLRNHAITHIFHVPSPWKDLQKQRKP